MSFAPAPVWRSANTRAAAMTDLPPWDAGDAVEGDLPKVRRSPWRVGLNSRDRRIARRHPKPRRDGEKPNDDTKEPTP